VRPIRYGIVLSQQRPFGPEVIDPGEALTVRRRFLNLVQAVRSLIKEESGQDLVEYALVIALIALAATVGMKSLASGINKAFDSVSVSLATDI